MEKYSDDRNRPFTDYQKCETGVCIYCGGTSNTREHLPSKVLFNHGLPMDYPTLPCCHECNESFSRDELYVRILLERFSELGGTSFYSKYSKKYYSITKKISNRYVTPQDRENLHPEDCERLGSILSKLGRGHMVYEEDRFFHCDLDGQTEPVVYYGFSFDATEEQIEDFNRPQPFSAFPEIGTRSFMRVFDKRHHDWIVMEPGVYRYLTCDNTCKIVIAELLYTVVEFAVE